MAEPSTRGDPIAALALLADPVRRRLYEHVSAHGPVGREAAASAVGISRVLAAFHLDKMVQAGLLRASYQRLTGRTGPGAGRPAKLYARTDGDVSVSLPARRYDVVAETFAEGLAELSEEVGGEAVAAAVQRRAQARGMASGREARRLAGPRAGRRRAREALTQRLMSEGYEPRVDESSGAITLANCPYRALSDTHRSLTCGMNLAWAEGLVRGSGAAGLTPHLDPELGRCCVVFQPASEA